MAASDHLSPQQFPHYEVGPDEEHGREWDVTNYGPEDKVHPSQFGLPTGKAEGELHYAAGAYQTRTVPTDSLVALQQYVYAPHVRNLAQVPGEQIEAHNRVLVNAMQDGRYAIDDGTHRAAAARLRGDKTIRVDVGGHYK